ncbi:hypothetical protein [Actinomadura sp. 9N407]|uniref:hypothetical protein n=1 Tax=Actinomadura sp. 9N407 TaxID=3375154 RepID=UPI0037B7292F
MARRLITSLALAAATAAASVAMAAPSSAATYQWSAGQLSPQYVFGSGGTACYYRIRYGNFGNVAYAQIRFYAGACGGTRAVALGQTGGTITEYWDDQSAITGADGCGQYIEIQATSVPDRIGVGMEVHRPNNAGVNTYWHTTTAGQQTPVRYC